MSGPQPAAPNAEARLAQRIRRLRALLNTLSARLEQEIAPLAGSYFTGEVRSRLRVMHGLEREISDVFRPGDEARQIDVRHLPGTLATSSLEMAVALQQIRRERFSHYSDTELILVLDLSLSMLTGGGGISKKPGANRTLADVHVGSLSEEGPPEAAVQGDKLWGLYLAICLFLTLGEQAGFVLRTVFARDGHADAERALRPREFRYRTLHRSTEELITAYTQAERHPAGKEQRSLAPGLEAALEARTRSVVLIISDFLDPVSEYRNLLMECFSRHHLVAIDVANWWEVRFPKPAPFWKSARWLADRDLMDSNWREAARRVEDGTEPRPLRREQIDEWNRQIQERRHELQSLCSDFEAGFCSGFSSLSLREAVKLANFHLALVGR